MTEQIEEVETTVSKEETVKFEARLKVRNNDQKLRYVLAVAGFGIITAVLALHLITRIQTGANDPFVGRWNLDPPANFLGSSASEVSSAPARMVLEFSQAGYFKVSVVANSNSFQPFLEGKYQVLNGGQFHLEVLKGNNQPFYGEYLFHYQVSLGELILVDQAGNKYKFLK